MKLILLKRKNILFMTVVITFIIAIIILLAPMMNIANEVNATEKRIPIYKVETEKKEASLSFNCAWGNEDVDILIDILKKYDIKSTFFVTGDWAERFPDDVKKLYANGHEIQNHSYNHPHVASISKEDLIKDTKKAEGIIENLIGKKPTLYRAPYGEYDNDMMDVLEKELGYKVIQWDTDSRDWKKDYTVDKIVNSVVTGVNMGSIVLFHSGVENTPKSLEIIIEKLIEKGYELKKIEDILIKENYYIDGNGKMNRVKS